MRKRAVLGKTLAIAALFASLSGITAGTASAMPAGEEEDAKTVCYLEPERGKVCQVVK